MIILGIETSCDETALAVYHQKKGLLGHILHSQINQLTEYGGIIPEIAARYHIQYLIPLLTTLLKNHNLNLKDIDFIAYTKGPGLIGSLLTGVAFAKSLSFALKIPALGIHHLEGHLLACFIQEANKPLIEVPEFPFLGLLASGGHTMLIQVNNIGNYKILGETLDDAAGEALDKTAKLLEISPPNGKSLSILADLHKNPNEFVFPKPLNNQNTLNFSFSGLKTAAMLQIKKIITKNQNFLHKNSYNNHQDEEPKNNIIQEIKANLAYSFQEAVMDSLIIKCKQALIKTKLNRLVIAGGVSANKSLRTKLLSLEKDLLNNNTNIKIFFPKLEFCTDNAAMIAIAGSMRANFDLKDLNYDIEALPRWNLETITL